MDIESRIKALEGRVAELEAERPKKKVVVNRTLQEKIKRSIALYAGHEGWVLLSTIRKYLKFGGSFQKAYDQLIMDNSIEVLVQSPVGRGRPSHWVRLVDNE